MTIQNEKVIKSLKIKLKQSTTSLFFCFHLKKQQPICFWNQHVSSQTLEKNWEDYFIILLHNWKLIYFFNIFTSHLFCAQNLNSIFLNKIITQKTYTGTEAYKQTKWFVLNASCLSLTLEGEALGRWGSRSKKTHIFIFLSWNVT